MAIFMHRLAEIARTADQLSHGERTAYYKRSANEMGISLPTLYRQLRDAAMIKQRKRRKDSGKTSLTKDEAQLISALLMESIRRNNKQLSSVKLAVKRLRSNGLIKAERVDEATGEVKPLSVGAISRALRRYRLHPEQLLQPAPAVELASKHPNHVWQVDASISTQFYLGSDGVRAMDRSIYYDGKPGNLDKIKKQRLWRYVITDHTSGALYVEYVLGAESAENLANVLINAMQKRGSKDPFHGVPFAIVTDPGAAMTSGIFRNLCRALTIELIINKVGNARAKGQVEQAHNLVECDFESGLKLQGAETLEQINEWAWRWMRYFNATEVHTRTRKTRNDVWMLIKEDQLRIPPSIEVCRELAISEPETRKVTPKLRVSFRGAEFDVSDVPNVMVGEKLLITRNPWRDEDTAQVLCQGENGRDFYHLVYRVNKDEFGFSEGAAVFGESYKSHKETPAQVARKTLEQIATGTTSNEDAKAARKAKVKPFGGAIDPHKHVDETYIPSAISKRGTDTEIDGPSIEIKPLSHVDAAKLLATRLGERWQGAEHFAWLQQHYPDGVREEQLGAIEQQLTRPAKAAGAPLRLLKGA